jgi:hypothetical protein
MCETRIETELVRYVLRQWWEQTEATRKSVLHLGKTLLCGLVVLI